MRHVMLCLMSLALAAGASASVFCGGNGLVTLSFTPAPEITRVAEAEAGEPVEVYAILDGVELVDGPGGVVLAMGGFECELRIIGAEPASVDKAVLVPHRDFGQLPTRVWAGFAAEGVRLDRGPVALVRWTVSFDEKPVDVRFELDPEGLLSCAGLEGCLEANVTAIYNGALDVRQESRFFGAGFAPAVLNPTGEPDLAEHPCTVGFAEVGIFKAR